MIVMLVLVLDATSWVMLLRYDLYYLGMQGGWNWLP